MAKAQEIVRALEDFLASTVGVAEVVVDGQKVSYDRKQAMEELTYWRAEAAKQGGKLSRFRSIDIGSAW